jgi:hypothetical protein
MHYLLNQSHKLVVLLVEDILRHRNIRKYMYLNLVLTHHIFKQVAMQMMRGRWK